MIKGNVIKQSNVIARPELDYRSLEALNCSMIKLFDTDPVRFYEQFKLGKKKKNVKTTALTIGDLVDFYLLDCKGNDEEFQIRFEEKFGLFEEIKGSGQVFTLVDVLFQITENDTDENGVIKTKFESRFAEACRKVQNMKPPKYKGASKEKILLDFNSKGTEYFQKLIDNVGKTIIDISLVDKAKKVAELLKNDEFTKDLFDTDTDEVEHFPKLIIEWEMDGISCKSELDLIIVDHKNKIIYPKDLKTSYDNENFEYSYLKYRYDLQAVFYNLAIQYWAKENDMSDYEIELMEFIVADTSYNNRRPIRFQTSQEDYDNSLYGFSIKGVKYKGLKQIVSEIMWSEKSGIWNVSKEVFDNNGILKLNLNYD